MMNTPNLDFIGEMTEAQTDFTFSVITICEKYGRDLQTEFSKALLIMMQGAEQVVKRYEAFKSLMD